MLQDAKSKAAKIDQGKGNYYGQTRKEVQEQLKTALHQQQQGMLASGPQQTLKQFLAQWLEDHKHSIRVRSYERYEEMVRLHIIPVLGRYQLQL